MTDEPKKRDARAVILARRAHFVAAAMASIGIACGKEEKKPEPCLSVVQLPVEAGPTADTALDASAPGDGGAGVADAGSTTDVATTDAGSATDAGHVGATPKRDAGAHPHPHPQPHPCLKVAPHPCLLVAAPRNNDPF